MSCFRVVVEMRGRRACRQAGRQARRADNHNQEGGVVTHKEGGRDGEGRGLSRGGGANSRTSGCGHTKQNTHETSKNSNTTTQQHARKAAAVSAPTGAKRRQGGGGVPAHAHGAPGLPCRPIWEKRNRHRNKPNSCADRQDRQSTAAVFRHYYQKHIGVCLEMRCISTAKHVEC